MGTERLRLFWWPWECFQVSGSVCIPWPHPKPQEARAGCSPLHSGFCVKEIREYGLADKNSTHQPGPQPTPSASVPASDGTHRQEEQIGRLCTKPGLQVRVV